MTLNSHKPCWPMGPVEDMAAADAANQDALSIRLIVEDTVAARLPRASVHGWMH